MENNKPFLLSPAAKDYLWGGNKINRIFGKNIFMYPLAETWECSVHPDGQSKVREGDYQDRLLGELFEEHPELWSAEPKAAEDFPLLIKFIDAKQSLSVQVHPTDDYARKVENQPRGKTEVWYIIDAEPGASIVYGFSKDTTPEEVAAAAEEGRLEELLRYVPVEAGDVIPIPAGTVHAIGAGILLAEIQENSNLTYRLYDWNRKGSDGKLRPLHIDKAKDVMVTDSEPPFFGQFREEDEGIENLVLNSWFSVDRLKCMGSYVYGKYDDAFAVFLCINGSGTCDDISFTAGDCIFLPRNCGQIAFEGDFTALISQQ